MRPRRTYHHGELRNALLREAGKLVLERGLHGWTLREVARRLGVSHAAPHHHFASKELLLESLAEQGFLRLAESLEAVAKLRFGSPLEELTALGKGYVLFAAEAPGQFQVMFRGEAIAGSTSEPLARARERALAPLTEVIRRAHARGILAVDDCDDAVMAAWCIVHGLATLWTQGALTEGGPASSKRLAAICERVSGALVEGLRNRPARPSGAEAPLRSGAP